MDLEIALEFVNQVLITETGRSLRPPEVKVFCGTWQGATYEQMAASSSYSSNYLMRDIAPKFWKLLSTIFERNISKSNLRIQLEQICNSPQKELASNSQSSNGICHKRLEFGRAIETYERRSLTNPIQADDRQNDAQNWSSIIALPSVVYGRNREVELAKQWIADRSKLIKIWGQQGIGKTLLMKKIGTEIEQQYEVVVWRSLASAPKLTEFIEGLLQSGFGISTRNRNSNQLLSELMAQMRSRPCLMMFDGVEAILQPKTLSGRYLPDRENYAEFFKIVVETVHQSCVIVTSNENFNITTQSDSQSAVRSLKLSGLSTSEAVSLLESQVDITDIPLPLVEYYRGNPEILIAAARIIRELFNGNAREFMAQESLVFGEIARLISKSFDRLSAIETEILYWLASKSQPMTLAEIQESIPLSIYPVELIEALGSLTQRSLIETTRVEQRSVFTLSPTIAEFAIDRLIAQVGDNFSVANRQNSTIIDNTIELGKISQITHLSLWLENKFESGWQPVETLFAASGRSPARLRSAFNLRGEGVVKRFKQINLNTDDPVAVLLLVAIDPEETAFKICVQAQPALLEETLPDGLQLNLVDAENTVLATIASQSEDNFIQLPYFRGTKNEKFKVGIELDSASYREEFMI